MSSNQNNEGVIRRAMIDADVVEVMVALPPQLFFNTQIPACLWFFAKAKSGAGTSSVDKERDRRGEVLFIDSRKLGRMASRVNRVFDDVDIKRIATTVHCWRKSAEDGANDTYADIPGFCRSVSLGEIAAQDFVLTPGRYVGSESPEDDEEEYQMKMERLSAQLAKQVAAGVELDALVRERLASIGYGV